MCLGHIQTVQNRSLIKRLRCTTKSNKMPSLWRWDPLLKRFLCELSVWRTKNKLVGFGSDEICSMLWSALLHLLLPGSKQPQAWFFWAVWDESVAWRMLICTMLTSIFITIAAKLLQIIYFNHLSKQRFKLISWIVTTFGIGNIDCLEAGKLFRDIACM